MKKLMPVLAVAFFLASLQWKDAPTKPKKKFSLKALPVKVKSALEAKDGQNFIGPAFSNLSDAIKVVSNRMSSDAIVKLGIHFAHFTRHAGCSLKNQQATFTRFKSFSIQNSTELLDFTGEFMYSPRSRSAIYIRISTEEETGQNSDSLIVQLKTDNITNKIPWEGISREAGNYRILKDENKRVYLCQIENQRIELLGIFVFKTDCDKLKGLITMQGNDYIFLKKIEPNSINR